MNKVQQKTFGKRIFAHFINPQEVQKQTEQNFKSSEQQKNDRINKLLTQASTFAPQAVVQYIQAIIPFVTQFISLVDQATPHLINAYNKTQALINQLPWEIVNAIVGLILCFFGSYFTVTIAAYEAFVNSGWEQVKENFAYLKTEYDLIRKADEEDNNKDEDGDGVKDVDQISGGKMLSRKVNVYLVSCNNPLKVQECINGIIFCIVSVITVLKLQFAKTIMLAAQIGEYLRSPSSYVLVPVLANVMPKEYHKWITVIINYSCKAIALSFAWFIQKIISGVQSAIKGGLIFSRNVIAYANKQGYINIDMETSYVDEALGWAIAVIGLYFQLSHFFGLPFPLNILLLPLRLTESTLIWAIQD